MSQGHRPGSLLVLAPAALSGSCGPQLPRPAQMARSLMLRSLLVMNTQVVAEAIHRGQISFLTLIGTLAASASAPRNQ